MSFAADSATALTAAAQPMSAPIAEPKRIAREDRRRLRVMGAIFLAVVAIDLYLYLPQLF